MNSEMWQKKVGRTGTKPALINVFQALVDPHVGKYVYSSFC